MNRITKSGLAGTGLLLAVLGAVVLLRPAPPEPAASSQDARMAASGARESPSVTAAGAPTAPQDAQSRPLARAAFEQEIAAVFDYREAVQGFVDTAGDLAPLEADRRARELLARLDELTTAGRVTANERLLVELALRRWLQAPESWDVRRARLIEDAQERAETRQQEPAEPDPVQADYRRRATASAREILENTEGLPERERQEILRTRLQALRSELWPPEQPRDP